MALDLIIRNGMVVGADRVSALAIGVSDGRIVELAPEISGAAREEIDATGLHVFPGVIDAHVHFNDPGRADWEGIATGSSAHAAGGGVCWFDMPLNSAPPTVTPEAFDLKLAVARTESRTDFAFWGGLVPGHLDDLEALAERGVVGFKAFMCSSGIDDFAACDDYTLYEGMRRAAALDLPVAVHAENDAIVNGLARTALAKGRTSVNDYLTSRPAVAELEAIQRILMLAEVTGCSVHIVHVSTAAGVQLVCDSRGRGVDATCETCPHYLVLNDADAVRLGSVAKCAPPLRDAKTVDSLWSELREGAIDFVATDHSPSPAALKSSANFFQVWGGIASVQSLLPILLHAATGEKKLPLATLAELTSRNIAERFRLPRKARLEVGYDADFALVDLTASEPLREEHLLYRHKLTPYLGLPIHGYIRRTLVRGQTVFLDGKCDNEFRGQLVKPTRSR